jgi:hypothetical protein
VPDAGTAQSGQTSAKLRSNANACSHSATPCVGRFVEICTAPNTKWAKAWFGAWENNSPGMAIGWPCYPRLARARLLPRSLVGATTVAAGDGSRQPTDQEFQGARYQGKRVAETAAKLAG